MAVLVVACIATTERAAGFEFEAAGEAWLYGATPALTDKAYYRPFEVYVSGCRWFIRTRVTNNNATLREYFSPEDGVTIDQSLPLGETKALAWTNAQGKLVTQGPARPVLNVISNRFPVNASDQALPYLWFFFAAHCAWPTGTTATPLAFYDAVNYVQTTDELRLPATWARLQGEGSLLAWARFENPGKHYSRGPDRKLVERALFAPYDQGHLSAEFRVTSTTNVGDLVLPQTFYGKWYGPGTQKSRDDLRVLRHVTGVVHSVKATCSLGSFMPPIPADAIVVDRRLAHAQPSQPPAAYSGQRGRLATAEEVKKLHEAKTPKTPAKRSLIASVGFAVLLVAPIAVFWLRARRGKGGS